MRTALRLATLALALGLAPAARAEVKLGFVDIQRALKETGEGKAASAVLNSEFSERGKALEAKEKELIGVRDELQKQAALLTPEVRAKKIQEFQEKAGAHDEAKFKLQQEATSRERALVRPLADKMLSLLRELAQSKGYTMIFDHDPTGDRDRSGILYAPAAMDLTNELIREYDAKYPAAKKADAAPATPAAGKK
jgi:outer membrane protein